MANPKFDDYLNRQIYQQKQTHNQSRYGVVQAYDPINNTATVLLSSVDSHAADELITDVPCPTYLGMQMAAPDPGRLCWVVFTGSQNAGNAVITHFFNHKYNTYDYTRQTKADNGIPKFMLGR